MAMPVPPPLVPDTSRRDWTVDELALLPDDGNRYEIVDGELLVTPAPSWTHQEAAGLLYRRLSAYVEPLGMYCLIAPADVPLSRRTVVEPDVFVVPRRGDGALPHDFSEARQLTLAVEILSPSSGARRPLRQASHLPRPRRPRLLDRRRCQPTRGAMASWRRCAGGSGRLATLAARVRHGATGN